MNIKMTINSQLSKTESKTQTKQTEKKQIHKYGNYWRVISWEGKGRKGGKRYRD